jgi:hypothetical protein
VFSLQVFRQALDENGDGTVSREEFLHGCNKYRAILGLFDHTIDLPRAKANHATSGKEYLISSSAAERNYKPSSSHHKKIYDLTNLIEGWREKCEGLENEKDVMLKVKKMES